MGTRVALGFACVALVGVACACQRAPQRAAEPGPDAGMINASAALVEASTAPTEPSRGTDTADCGEAAARSLIGQPDTPAARAALARAEGMRAVRWITPGAIVTRDVLPKRLNVIVGDDGRIQSLRCG